MKDSSSLTFSYIDVEGYRGRNFKLDFDTSKSEHVFVMDGNTGKTTIIELLRWCFNYKESNAEGNFRHMFADPAHVMDWDYPGEEQECMIEIGFSKEGRNYVFKRTTKGTYSLDKDEDEEEDTGDIIREISDTLEIDRGNEVYQGDKVNRILNDLRISPSADYFLFDGERAREYMLYASDKKEVHNLVEAINKRVTPRRLTTYKQKLNELQKRIYDELGSKASKKGQTRVMNKINEIKRDINEAEEKKSNFEDEINIRRRKVIEFEDRIDELNKKIIDSKSEELEKRHDLEKKINTIKTEINSERENIIGNLLEILSSEKDFNIIEDIKENIRERGRLPEPYREDLIDLCLNSDPPSCEICGRELDEESQEKVKKLRQQVAPHEIQNFLNAEVPKNNKKYNMENLNKKINKKIEEYEDLDDELESLDLSDKEEKWIKERDDKRKKLREFESEIGDYKGDLEAIKSFIDNKKEERERLEEKSKTLKQYRIVLDEIEKAKDAIQKTKDEIKDETIEIISDTLGESVNYILGDNFSAKLTEDSLLLGQNDRFHREVGGMSGKLILSYCFAESMTEVNPMIIDTPVGNIDDSVREKLSEHLITNHNQIILLCLPTELDYFVDPMDPQKECVENKEEVTWVL